jgi:hypothetical protein
MFFGVAFGSNDFVASLRNGRIALTGLEFLWFDTQAFSLGSNIAGLQPWRFESTISASNVERIFAVGSFLVFEEIEIGGMRRS